MNFIFDATAIWYWNAVPVPGHYQFKFECFTILIDSSRCLLVKFFFYYFTFVSSGIGRIVIITKTYLKNDKGQVSMWISGIFHYNTRTESVNSQYCHWLAECHPLYTFQIIWKLYGTIVLVNDFLLAWTNLILFELALHLQYNYCSNLRWHVVGSTIARKVWVQSLSWVARFLSFVVV